MVVLTLVLWSFQGQPLSERSTPWTMHGHSHIYLSCDYVEQGPMSLSKGNQAQLLWCLHTLKVHLQAKAPCRYLRVFVDVVRWETRQKNKNNNTSQHIFNVPQRWGWTWIISKQHHNIVHSCWTLFLMGFHSIFFKADIRPYIQRGMIRGCN